MRILATKDQGDNGSKAERRPGNQPGRTRRSAGRHPGKPPWISAHAEPAAAAFFSLRADLAVERARSPARLVKVQADSDRFSNPVDVKAIPGQPDSLVVVEHQTGKIWY